MQHWTVTNVKDPTSLTFITEAPALPSPPPTDTVLLKHLSAIVCFTDSSVVHGTYFRSFPQPLTPGYTFVARVEAVGPISTKPFPRGCPPLAVGDLVAVMNTTGA
jgi:NADPH:quinone reductase-like Zn-dependent oxidoreductase